MFRLNILTSAAHYRSPALLWLRRNCWKRFGSRSTATVRCTCPFHLLPVSGAKRLRVLERNHVAERQNTLGSSARTAPGGLIAAHEALHVTTLRRVNRRASRRLDSKPCGALPCPIVGHCPELPMSAAIE